ncbi:hypothetical protein PGIGA_G00253560 [Pangasianodon gigas]|uniref:Uncharacterized protein n=1 Tax=Pangasianodon gigas TaxID=30993 RepID=A0ACC5WRB7_PANGG|nr:hypothetical protein [Pangasianodon gigas]
MVSPPSPSTSLPTSLFYTHAHTTYATSEVFSNDPGRKMDVAGLTSLLISTLIYHVLSNSFSAADKGFQPCSQNLTQCPPGNVTVQMKNYSVNNCGTNVHVTCNTSLPPNLICGFEWWQDQKKIDGQNQSTLVQKITKKVIVSCTVLSPCGNFTSSSNEINCNETDVATVLLICGVGAFIVILMFGITMKIMLKRGEVERQARRQQRQAMQSNDSTATVTSYW